LEVVYLSIYLLKFGGILFFPELNALVDGYYFFVKLALPARKLLSGGIFLVIGFHLLFLHLFVQVANFNIRYLNFFIELSLSVGEFLG